MVIFFFFNDTAPTEIYTLPLHDALPISHRRRAADRRGLRGGGEGGRPSGDCHVGPGTAADLLRALIGRSEEHTSELQSQSNLVCRLLLEKKKKMSVMMVQMSTAQPLQYT